MCKENGIMVWFQMNFAVYPSKPILRSEKGQHLDLLLKNSIPAWYHRREDISVLLCRYKLLTFFICTFFVVRNFLSQEWLENFIKSFHWKLDILNVGLWLQRGQNFSLHKLPWRRKDFMVGVSWKSVIDFEPSFRR